MAESENSQNTANAESNVSENVDVQALQAEVEALRQSKDRILAESKEWKSKFQSTRTEIENQERVSMEKKGDLEGLLAKANEKIGVLENSLNEREENLLTKSIHFEVARHAPDANDVNDVINNLKVNKNDIDLENFSVKGISEKIDDIRKGKPYLFKQNTAKMQTKMPSFKEKTIGEMSVADLKNAYKANLK